MVTYSSGWFYKLFSKDRTKQFALKEIKDRYNNPDKLVEIEFATETHLYKNIWIKPCCLNIDLTPDTEYRIVTHDRFFKIRFENDQVISYLQYSFGCKLYKRPTSTEIQNPYEWEIGTDLSDIN